MQVVYSIFGIQMENIIWTNLKEKMFSASLGFFCAWKLFLAWSVWSMLLRVMVLSSVNFVKFFVNRKFSQDVTEEETTEEIVTTEQVDFREVLKKVRNDITQCCIKTKQ